MINKQYVRKTAWIFFLFFLGLCVPCGFAQTVSQVALHALYTNKMMRIDAEDLTKKGGAAQEYGVDLLGTLKTVQQAGDFDGYVLVEKEIARFKSEKTVPASSTISQLAPSLGSYQKKIEAFNAESAAKKIDLSKQYLEALVSLRKELMLQSKMKEAGEVNDVAKKLESDIREMEAWQSNMGNQEIAPPKAETKLDELFGDETPSIATKTVSSEMAKVPEPSPSKPKKKSKKAPPEALELNGHFYLYCAERLKWDTAKSKCQTRGGYLVTIGSREENDFVVGLIKGKAAVWIGFYKPVDTWKWGNLEKTDYLNWSSGEPNITKRSPYMGVGICAFIRGADYVQPSSYHNGFYRPSRTELSGQWGDAYSDASVEGYVCEWDE